MPSSSMRGAASTRTVPLRNALGLTEALARESERSISAVARDLGMHPETLRVWVRQDEADDGSRTDRLTTAEREELAALRRETRPAAFQRDPEGGERRPTPARVEHRWPGPIPMDRVHQLDYTQ